MVLIWPFWGTVLFSAICAQFCLPYLIIKFWRSRTNFIHCFTVVNKRQTDLHIKGSNYKHFENEVTFPCLVLLQTRFLSHTFANIKWLWSHGLLFFGNCCVSMESVSHVKNIMNRRELHLTTLLDIQDWYKT